MLEARNSSASATTISQIVNSGGIQNLDSYDESNRNDEFEVWAESTRQPVQDSTDGETFESSDRRFQKMKSDGLVKNEFNDTRNVDHGVATTELRNSYSFGTVDVVRTLGGISTRSFHDIHAGSSSTVFLFNNVGQVYSSNAAVGTNVDHGHGSTWLTERHEHDGVAVDIRATSAGASSERNETFQLDDSGGYVDTVTFNFDTVYETDDIQISLSVNGDQILSGVDGRNKIFVNRPYSDGYGSSVDPFNFSQQGTGAEGYMRGGWRYPVEPTYNGDYGTNAGGSDGGYEMVITSGNGQAVPSGSFAPPYDEARASYGGSHSNKSESVSSGSGYAGVVGTTGAISGYDGPPPAWAYSYPTAEDFQVNNSDPYSGPIITDGYEDQEAANEALQAARDAWRPDWWGAASSEVGSNGDAVDILRWYGDYGSRVNFIGTDEMDDTAEPWLFIATTPRPNETFNPGASGIDGELRPNIDTRTGNQAATPGQAAKLIATGLERMADLDQAESSTPTRTLEPNTAVNYAPGGELAPTIPDAEDIEVGPPPIPQESDDSSALHDGSSCSSQSSGDSESAAYSDPANNSDSNGEQENEELTDPTTSSSDSDSTLPLLFTDLVSGGPQHAGSDGQNICAAPPTAANNGIEQGWYIDGQVDGLAVGDVFEIDGELMVGRLVDTTTYVVLPYHQVKNADSRTGDVSKGEPSWDEFFTGQSARKEFGRVMQRINRAIEQKARLTGRATAISGKRLQEEIENATAYAEKLQSIFKDVPDAAKRVREKQAAVNENKRNGSYVRFLDASETILDGATAFTPGVSDGRDVYEALSGYDIHGNKLTGAQRALTVVGAALPLAGAAALRKIAGPALDNAVEGVAGGIDALVDASKKSECGASTIGNVMRQAGRLAKKFCFAPDTPVQTPDGLRRIDEIKVGDLVKAFDFDSGEWVDRHVEETHHNFYEGPLVSIRLGSETVRCTVHHPFWVVSGSNLSTRPTPRGLKKYENENESLTGRWVDSHDIRPGDVIYTKDFQEIEVENVSQELTSNFQTCNLTVSVDPNFSVGTLSLLVHNTSVCDAIKNRKSFGFKSGTNGIDGLREATHADFTKAFDGTGFVPTGHFVTRLKDPRLSAMGVRSFADLRAIFRNGNQFDANNGAIGFAFENASIILDPSTGSLITIKPR